jgi:hypothetical protein
MRGPWLLMTPTAQRPVHGQAYSAKTLVPFLRVSPGSWIASASAPHRCLVARCPSNARLLWAQFALQSALIHAARLALARIFPMDICRSVVLYFRAMRAE